MPDGRIATVLLAVIVLAGPSAAALAPRAQLEVFFDRATTIVLGATDSRQAVDDVRQLTETTFDGRTAARQVLGPEWDRYSAAERDDFARTFTAVLARTYVEVARGWLPRDRAPVIRVLGEELAEAGRAATVYTSVRARDGRDVPVDYQMNRTDGGWLVHDVVIDGVSLLANYRAQFVRVSRTSSPAELIARLRAVAGTGGAEAGAASRIVAYFPPSRADLDPAARRAVTDAATWLAADERRRVVVEGHADRQGAARLNEALAERRAHAIRDSLVARGVAAERIAVVAYGDRRPICEEPAETCQAQNRRVVVRLTP
jgi:outer membrane protein OmpA-like peptidoglycan-associated protein